MDEQTRGDMMRLPFDTEKLIEICRQNDVVKVGVFGSMARGEANEASDIDLIVEFSRRTSLLALVGFERKLSVALGRKVDVLTEAALSPYLRDRIMGECQVIYEAR
ncbi:MAG: nucleotidyltransferase family protein [Chloroflexi bacterium]|nr:nucleotidyltransferase family protein [Chloroflexota bacterium]